MTFVRCFNSHVLDMLECSVVADTARTLAQFGGAKCKVGAKPLLSFSGPAFEQLNEGVATGNKFALAKSLFIDFFRGGIAKEIDVEGLQWMISFAACEEDGAEGAGKEVVKMRCWRIVTKRSGQKLPRVEVEEIGPRIDFRLGRMSEADEGTMKEALKQGKTTDVSIFSTVKAFLTRGVSGQLLTILPYIGETKEKCGDRSCR
jgi:ribosome production factor 2